MSDWVDPERMAEINREDVAGVRMIGVPLIILIILLIASCVGFVTHSFLGAAASGVILLVGCVFVRVLLSADDENHDC